MATLNPSSVGGGGPCIVVELSLPDWGHSFHHVENADAVKWGLGQPSPLGSHQKHDVNACVGHVGTLVYSPLHEVSMSWQWRHFLTAKYAKLLK